MSKTNATSKTINIPGNAGTATDTTNAHYAVAGKNVNIAQDTNLETWADSLPRCGVYDAYLTVAQGNLPAAYWYIELQRYSSDVAGNLNHVITAKLLSAGTGLMYTNTCFGGVWTGWIPSNPFTYNQAVAWNGSTDRVLGIGQHTWDSFTSATSMPLHIACGDGQEYEIDMVGGFTPAAPGVNTVLKANNSGGFTCSLTQLQGYAASTVAYGVTSETDARLASQSSPYMVEARIWASTATKRVKTVSLGYETTNLNRFLTAQITYSDTTTVWSSLGTITMPNAWTGTVVVRRIA